MSILHDVAVRTLQSMPEVGSRGDLKQFEVLTIILLLKLALLAWECFRLYPDKAVEQCREPGFIVRWRLRRLVKNHLRECGGNLPVQEVYAALLDVAKGVTEADIEASLKELDA